MKVVVGLGNPDKKYKRTYHNVGFLVVDKILEKLDQKLNKRECKGKSVHGNIDGNKYIIIKPLTYMNLSGECVSAIKKKFKVDDTDILIIFDDIDLPCGKIRLREKGSGGSHNGMKNIVMHTSEEVKRLRVGIGQETKVDSNSLVLSEISEQDADKLQDAFDKASDAVIEFIKGEEFLNVMGKFNPKRC